MIQDAPVSGTPLSAVFLVRMAQEVPNVRYFKIEVPQAAAKLRQMIELGGEAIEGPWDGEEAITLLPDVDAGATGSMTGAAIRMGSGSSLIPTMQAGVKKRQPARSIAGSTRSRTLVSTAASDHGACPTKCSSDWC